jgi:hypothetical protein
MDQREKMRQEEAMNKMTAAGYTVRELAAFGEGAYETNEYFITNYHGIISLNQKGSKGDKHVRWLLERGASLPQAERLNTESLRITNIGIIAGATGGLGPAGTAITLAGDAAQGNQRVLDAFSKNPVRKLKFLRK